MILRALFWISVVVILMPREPDLGLGRPGLTSRMNGESVTRCSQGSTCATLVGLIDRLQALAIRNLAEVKGDIEAEQKRSRPD